MALELEKINIQGYTTCDEIYNLAACGGICGITTHLVLFVNMFISVCCAF